MVRVGTVNAATVPLLIPTVREFRAAHPLTQVEVVGAQQTEIHRTLSEGGLDLGLVNHLDGDDLPADFETTELLRGRPVVCLRPDSPLAALDAVSAADLLDGREALIKRAPGRRHRPLSPPAPGGPRPGPLYTTDGAEMGKLMVAEGLGATVLPDFSVIGDPLERCGAITHRPLTDDTTRVLLMLRRRRAESVPRAAHDLHEAFVRRGRRSSAAGCRGRP